MKQNEKISKSLGLTQEQLAMLLGTTRSRISLFELNLRSLPRAAEERLAKILAVAAKGNKPIGKQILSVKEKAQHQLVFKEMLQENDYQQQVLQQKMTALKEKQDKGLKGQALLEYLAAKDEKENPLFLFMPPESRNAKHVKKNAQQQLLKYEIKLKVLQYEAELLKKEMG